MNKYNNPRLLNTVVSGTGMKNPVRPHVIIGSEKNGFIRGDLMDANAVKEAVAEEVAERIDADLNLSEEIDTKVRQAVDDLVDGAPEVLDTLKELSEAIGDDENFITTVSGKITDIEALLPKVPNTNGHEYVDLGLPSGTLWATCNVGASSPEEYGDYYMWGMGNKTYDAADTPYDGTEDTLDLSRDTARQVMGGAWHMPTATQMQELIANTTYQWTTINGVNGGKFTATNGKYVFFPAAGEWYDGSQDEVGDNGYYWGSSPHGSHSVYYLRFSDGGKDVGNGGRKYGYSVRGVIDPEDANKTFIPVASKDEVLTNEKVVAAALNDLNKRTIFTPTPVDPNETVGIFAGSLTTDELEDLVTNTNTRKFLTTVRGNKTLIVGFVDFFTDWAGHQITAVATSNIHLDEWDNESDLTLVPHTDGKANVYVSYCGLHDPAGYSGLVEGEWTRWKKFNTDIDDLNEVTSSLKDREYMDSSTFDAIFTEADSDAIDWIIDNFAPTFYVKDSSDNVTTCSIVRSATAVCVTRNKVDNTTYTFINECRRGMIGSSGSINWSDWTTISSTVTPAPAA